MLFPQEVATERGKRQRNSQDGRHRDQSPRRQQHPVEGRGQQSVMEVTSITQKHSEQATLRPKPRNTQEKQRSYNPPLIVSMLGHPGGDL